MATDALQAAREALDRNHWQEAFSILEPLATSDELSAQDLAGFADAAWWTGRLDRAIEARERAYALSVNSGESRPAAAIALKLAKDYGHRLAPAVSDGWRSRAERLLEDDHECPEYGLLVRTRVNQEANRGDLSQAYALATEMLDLGNKLGDRDLQALAIHEQGRVLVRLGKVDEGMSLLDEAAVAAVSGELSATTTATIYCNVIEACRSLADYRRAGDWTEAAKRWCERQAITGFPGICRVYRAEIMRLRGDWSSAESEALKAADELQGWALDVVGAAFREIGEIRLRIGDFDGAEQAFSSAHEAGEDPQPGLALLMLARGDVGAASSSIRRSVEETSDRLARARLLPTAVEIAIKAGDHDDARVYSEELGEIAAEFDTPALRAAAAWTEGVTLLDAGDVAAALKALRNALQLWNEVDAPYEAARARMTLAQAYRADGDDQATHLEVRSARSALERLGAGCDLQQLNEFAKREAVAPASPVARETKTFMFTDICKSTNIVEAIGDEAWEDLLRWHDETLGSLFAEHGGQEIKQLGEGFFVAFADPIPGIECAIAIQRRLAEHRRSAGFSPQIRIGLHVSEATRRGEDYGGRGVHVAARIGAQADAGEILCSQDTVGSVDGDIYRASNRRAVSLKGISDPVEVATIDWR